jgi:hypothetical protein
VADRVGSRIAQATGGAGERGSRFCRARQRSAQSSRSLRAAKLGALLVLVRGLVRHGTMGSLRRGNGGDTCGAPNRRCHAARRQPSMTADAARNGGFKATSSAPRRAVAGVSRAPKPWLRPQQRRTRQRRAARSPKVRQAPRDRTSGYSRSGRPAPRRGVR